MKVEHSRPQRLGSAVAIISVSTNTSKVKDKATSKARVDKYMMLISNATFAFNTINAINAINARMNHRMGETKGKR